MKKKWIFLLVVVAFGVAIYWLLFHKDKTLKYIPESADMVVLVDVKNVSRLYLSELLMNPSEWGGPSEDKEDKISMKDAGIKIPDYLQFFHLKNTDVSNWNLILELSDQQEFSQFLKQEAFEKLGKNIFKKDKITLEIIGERCLIQLGNHKDNSEFGVIAKQMRSPENTWKTLDADQFIDGSHGSLSIINGDKINNFPLEVGENEITISNLKETSPFNSLIENLAKRRQFLEASLDKKALDKTSQHFKKQLNDYSAAFPLMSSVSLTSSIEEINDTIVSYEYDDNFNEIEKVSYQKILQPIYSIEIKSDEQEKLWTLFQEKKWISSDNKFTAIPFQPNKISKNGKLITIQSQPNPIESQLEEKRNFVFVNNNEKLIRSFSTISEKQKKDILKIAYLFYGNTDNQHFFRIQFKKEEIPLILRF